MYKPLPIGIDDFKKLRKTILLYRQNAFLLKRYWITEAK